MQGIITGITAGNVSATHTSASMKAAAADLRNPFAIMNPHCGKIFGTATRLNKARGKIINAPQGCIRAAEKFITLCKVELLLRKFPWPSARLNPKHGKIPGSWQGCTQAAEKLVALRNIEFIWRQNFSPSLKVEDIPRKKFSPSLKVEDMPRKKISPEFKVDFVPRKFPWFVINLIISRLSIIH